MANIRNGNTFYIDAASDTGTAASFIVEKGLKVSHIVLTSSAAGDEIVINDLDSTTENTAGALKFSVKNSINNDTKHVHMEESMVTFPNGIFISSITAGAKATLVLSSRGG